jgi:hypothetical protein
MAKLAVCIIILTSSLKPMGQNGNQFVELISQKILVKNKTGTIKEVQVNMVPIFSKFSCM